MRRFRTTWAPIAAACAVGFLASDDARAQLFRRTNTPRATAPAVPNDKTAEAAIPSKPSRSARQLLRNGIDYLDTYGDADRALSYLKEARKHEQELTRKEIESLHSALARAQRILSGTEVARAPTPRRVAAPAISSGLQGDTSLLDQQPSRLAQRRTGESPAKSDRAVLTTATGPDAMPEPLALGGIVPAPASPPTAASRTDSTVVAPAQNPAPTAPAAAPRASDDLPELDEPAEAIGLRIVGAGDNPGSAEVVEAAPLPVLPRSTDNTDLGKLDQATPRLDLSIEDEEPTAAPAPDLEAKPADQPAASTELADPPTDLTESADPALPLLPIQPAEADEALPELAGSPTDPKEANAPRAPADGRALLLPPAAPRSIQQLQGIDTVAEPSMPATPVEPAEMALDGLPANTPGEDAEPPARHLNIPAVRPAQSDVAGDLPPLPAIGRSEPGALPRQPEATVEEAPALAPAPAAEELLEGQPSGDLAIPDPDSLPDLPSPPPALPQPRPAAAASGEPTGASTLPPPPPATERVQERGAAIGDARLPDPVPDHPGTQIKLRRKETLREIEELARRQQANESRNSLDDLPYTDASTRRDDATIDLPRAPSSTEARPIKPIEIPEEFIPLEARNFTPLRKYWAAPAICHTPLYFQDAVLERYGQSVEQAAGPHWGRILSYPLDDPRQSIQRQPLLQPAYSSGMFLLQLASWPYNLIMDPPWEAQYDLGYYRPGDPIPPDTTYLPTTGLGPPLRGKKY